MNNENSLRKFQVKLNELIYDLFKLNYFKIQNKK